MSGHSKWAKVHRQKTATDAKKGAVFTKLGNLITLAAKEGGGDLESNFKLRLAVEKAKGANMPKDNIERAIKRGGGGGGEGVVLEEITYEGFGPAGSIFVVETITDNKNRTVSEVKSAFSKNGGQLAGANSVLWQFEKKGLIFIGSEQLKNKNWEQLELDLIDAGAEDIKKNADEWKIITTPDRWPVAEKNIKALNIGIGESLLGYQAKKEIIITDKIILEKINKLDSALKELDDVSNIYTNLNL